jgi:hypothetical protein
LDNADSSIVMIPVPAERLDHLWPPLAGYLAAGLEHAQGELTLDQLRLLVVQGHADLLSFWRGRQPVGATAIEYLRYPQYTVAQVISFGGQGLFSDEAGMAQVRHWCKHRGASQMQALCRPAITRFARRLGFAPAYDLIRSTL